MASVSSSRFFFLLDRTSSKLYSSHRIIQWTPHCGNPVTFGRITKQELFWPLSTVSFSRHAAHVVLAEPKSPQQYHPWPYRSASHSTTPRSPTRCEVGPFHHCLQHCTCNPQPSKPTDAHPCSGFCTPSSNGRYCTPLHSDSSKSCAHMCPPLIARASPTAICTNRCIPGVAEITDTLGHFAWGIFTEDAFNGARCDRLV